MTECIHGAVCVHCQLATLQQLTERVEEPEEVLTAAQAAELLGFSVDHVYRALKDGTLPGLRVGYEWRLSKRALLAALGGAHDRRMMTMRFAG